MDDVNFPTKYFLTTVKDWDTFQEVKRLMGKNIKNTNCIITIGGFGSGKTTTSKYIINKYNYKRYYFAYHLKKYIMKNIWNLDDRAKKCHLKYNITPNELEDKINKLNKYLIDNNLPKLKVNEIDYIVNNIINKHFIVSIIYRKLMQYIGTEIVRKRDELFWVKKTVPFLIRENNNVIIDDVRFYNEYEQLKDIYGDNLYVIKIVRPTKENNLFNISAHVSEQEYLKIPYDYLIVNDKSLLNLYNEVDDIIYSIRKKRSVLA